MKTNKIIIVGGGSAGWMTAATLIKKFPNKDITLIESPNTPTVGVGESTIGQINDWLALIGVKDEDFMPYTDASYKLSIRFEDFYKKGDGGFHYPFGTHTDKDYVAGHRTWFFKKILYSDLPYSDYVDSIYSQMGLIHNNRIFKNENNDLPSFDFNSDVAYHFDATKFGLWLKEHLCIPNGVKHIKEDIISVEKNNEGIQSLNKKYSADLYIDCTGFKSLLLDKSLNEPFISLEDMLPNNKAWATRVPYKDKEKQLEPYTNCTAIENGWVWNIPSWERIGTGYVYSDKYVTDEQALQEFKNHLNTKGHDYSNSEFKNIKMRVGIHNRIFVKNVCAIGLSAGFIEPLESNGLYTTHEFLYKLVRILNRGEKDTISQYDKDMFNSSCKSLFLEFSEFVAAHYALSHRDDTKYWRDINNREYSKNLIDLNPQFYNGFVHFTFSKMRDYKYDMAGGFAKIAVGMRNLPLDMETIQHSDTIKDKNEILNIIKKEYMESFNKMEFNKKHWNDIALKQETLYSFLKKNIHNE